MTFCDLNLIVAGGWRRGGVANTWDRNHTEPQRSEIEPRAADLPSYHLSFSPGQRPEVTPHSTLLTRRTGAFALDPASPSNAQGTGGDFTSPGNVFGQPIECDRAALTDGGRLIHVEGKGD